MERLMATKLDLPSNDAPPPYRKISIESKPADNVTCNNDRDRKPPPAKGSRRRLRTFLRTVKLHVFSVFLIGRKQEVKKIAFTKDTVSTWLAILPHVISLCLCLAPVVMNATGVYIGRELPGKLSNSLSFLALQLAAKVIELVVTDSLGMVVFTKLRELLVHGTGPPLGAIAVSFRINAVSNLWSPDFIALCRSRFTPASRQLAFIAAVSSSTVLSLLVGSAAATTLKPFIADWAGGGTPFWLNATHSTLFPTIVTAAHAPAYRCYPSTGTPCASRIWDVVSDNLFTHWPRVSDFERFVGKRPEMVERAYIPGVKSSRPLTTRLVGPFMYHPPFSMASINSAAVASAVAQLCTLFAFANTEAYDHGFTKSFRWYNDYRCSVDTLQPATFVKCNSNEGRRLQSAKQLSFTSPLGEALAIVPDSFSSNVSSFSQLQPNSSLIQNNSSSLPKLNWVQLSGTPSSQLQPYLGAIIAMPSSQPSTIATRGQEFLSCTIDARWINASTDVTFSGGPKSISSSLQQSLLEGFFNNGQGISDFPAVQLTVDWANAINIRLERDNVTIFDKLSTSIGLQRSSTRLGPDPNAALEPLHAVEAVLVTMLANAMGLIADESSLQGILKGSSGPPSPILTYTWQTALLNHENIFDIDPTITSTYPAHQFHVTVNGYGYGYSTSNLLSMIVLCSYSVISIVHIIHSLLRRRPTSQSWDTISEMLALALRSEKCDDDALENTGAGIECIASLKTPVSIRVTDDQCLQLRAGKVQDLGGGNGGGTTTGYVRPDVQYG